LHGIAGWVANSCSPVGARADHVDATLAAAGWLIDPGSEDDPVCDAHRVAQELDIYPTTARRWMADGTIRTVTLPDATGVSRRYARLSDVWSHRDCFAGRILPPNLAEELGISYHEAYHALRRIRLAVDQHPTSRQYHLSAEAADALRAERQRIQALHRRSMKLAAAARQLGVALSTAALLSRTGQLEVDPEIDSSGARFVTRRSVEAHMTRRHGGRPARRREVGEANP